MFLKTTPMAQGERGLEELTECFEPAALAGIEGLVKWSNRQSLEAAVRQNVAANLERARDLAGARRQLARFGDRHNQLQDFAARLIEQDGACLAVAEIRFKGMRKDEPFVELSLLSAPDEQLPEVVCTALEAFSALAPLRARAWFGRSKTPNPMAEFAVSADQQLLVGQLRTLKQLQTERVVESGTLRLEPIGELELAYRRYADLHAQYVGQCPQIASELYCSTPGEFEKLVFQGMAFDAFVEGRWAGLVAAAPEQLWGQPGIAMHEEFLTTEFRGRGLGRTLQRALIDRLAAPPETLLWGTIHDSNQPSLRTALAVGREPLGAFFWLQGSEASASRKQ